MRQTHTERNTFLPEQIAIRSASVKIEKKIKNTQISRDGMREHWESRGMEWANENGMGRKEQENEWKKKRVRKIDKDQEWDAKVAIFEDTKSVKERKRDREKHREFKRQPERRRTKKDKT